MEDKMRLFCGLIHMIVHVLATVEVPNNNSEAEWLNTTKENVTAPESSKIIGGDLADPADFRPIAFLVIKRRAGISECTGTVLDDYFVLTAGHCVVDSLSVIIYIGCKELYNCKEVRTGVGILHPRFATVDNVTYNDIGLVHSNRRISSAAHTVLPTVSTYFENCVVLGYGFTTEDTKIPNTKLHKLQVYEVLPCTYFFPSVVGNPMVCSLAQSNRVYSFGDFGGPLFCGKTQVGVTSKLKGFKKEGEHALIMSWTPVDLYLEWIQLTIMISSSSHPSLTILLVVVLLLLLQFTN